MWVSQSVDSLVQVKTIGFIWPGKECLGHFQGIIRPGSWGLINALIRLNFTSLEEKRREGVSLVKALSLFGHVAMFNVTCQRWIFSFESVSVTKAARVGGKKCSQKGIIIILIWYINNNYVSREMRGARRPDTER